MIAALTEIFSFLEFTQNHGGLMVICTALVMHLRYMRKELDEVKSSCKDSTAKHEAIFHNIDRRHAK